MTASGGGERETTDEAGGPSSPTPDTRIGTLLEGKYEILRALGNGGMGRVYAARNVRIGRRVAIKFLHAYHAVNAQVARRFETEARAAGMLEHENIAAVHDFGLAPDGSRFIVMDFLDGEDCAELLAREGPLPVTRATGIIFQVCRGLEVAHRAGIVHRDLKPANLFVTQRADGSDLVKVLDFGVAKLRTGSEGASSTATGLALGTPSYMSPEQARGARQVDHRSDIYALGVILYEFLCGQRAHAGSSQLEIIYSILHGAPTPLQELRSGLPSGLVSVVSAAMSPDPAARPPSAAEFGHAIASCTGAAATPFRTHVKSQMHHPLDGLTLADPVSSRRPATNTGAPLSLPAAHPTLRRGTGLIALLAAVALAAAGAATRWLWGLPAAAPAAAEAVVSAESVRTSPGGGLLVEAVPAFRPSGPTALPRQPAAPEPSSGEVPRTSEPPANSARAMAPAAPEVDAEAGSANLRPQIGAPRPVTVTVASAISTPPGDTPPVFIETDPGF